MSGKNNNNVFAEFEGKREVNGRKRKYWVQRATEEYYDEMLQLMGDGFVQDEPLCRYLDLPNCHKSRNEIKHKLYPHFLKQHLALVCLTRGDDGKPTIAGINVTILATTDDPHYEPEGEKWKIVYGVVEYVTKYNDAFEKLGLDRYLSAMGLFVLPEYRGEGLGLALLKAREPLCRQAGIKASCTVFTATASQILAERAGFKDLTKISYDELFRTKPEFYVPRIQEHTTHCRFMYIEYK